MLFPYLRQLRKIWCVSLPQNPQKADLFYRNPFFGPIRFLCCPDVTQYLCVNIASAHLHKHSHQRHNVVRLRQMCVLGSSPLSYLDQSFLFQVLVFWFRKGKKKARNKKRKIKGVNFNAAASELQHFLSIQNKQTKILLTNNKAGTHKNFCRFPEEFYWWKKKKTFENQSLLYSSASEISVYSVFPQTPAQTTFPSQHQSLSLHTRLKIPQHNFFPFCVSPPPSRPPPPSLPFSFSPHPSLRVRVFSHDDAERDAFISRDTIRTHTL